MRAKPKTFWALLLVLLCLATHLQGVGGRGGGGFSGNGESGARSALPIIAGAVVRSTTRTAPLNCVAVDSTGGSLVPPTSLLPRR
jgi:hypothetical protein